MLVSLSVPIVGAVVMYATPVALPDCAAANTDVNFTMTVHVNPGNCPVTHAGSQFELGGSECQGRRSGPNHLLPWLWLGTPWAPD